jgi:hypothetical protein
LTQWKISHSSLDLTFITFHSIPPSSFYNPWSYFAFPSGDILVAWESIGLHSVLPAP